MAASASNACSLFLYTWIVYPNFHPVNRQFLPLERPTTRVFSAIGINSPFRLFRAPCGVSVAYQGIPPIVRHPHHYPRRLWWVPVEAFTGCGVIYDHKNYFLITWWINRLLNIIQPFCYRCHETPFLPAPPIAPQIHPLGLHQQNPPPAQSTRARAPGCFQE